TARSISTIVLLACVAALSPPPVRAETLRSVISESSPLPDTRALANLDREITSYAILNNAKWFGIAYYLDAGADFLEEPLWIDRYDRLAKEWRFTSLTPQQIHGGPADCLGS